MGLFDDTDSKKPIAKIVLKKKQTQATKVVIAGSVFGNRASANLPEIAKQSSAKKDDGIIIPTINYVE